MNDSNRLYDFLIEKNKIVPCYFVLQLGIQCFWSIIMLLHSYHKLLI